MEAIVGGVVSDLQPEADASPVFSSTVVLTCSSSALACTVVVITTGARKRPNTAQAALPRCYSTMVAMVSPRFTRSLVSTIHAVTLCRRSGLLSCLRTWPPDLADMAGTRPLVVTMFLSTVPPVDCKCAAAAAGPSSG